MLLFETSNNKQHFSLHLWLVLGRKAQTVQHPADCNFKKFNVVLSFKLPVSSRIFIINALDSEISQYFCTSLTKADFVLQPPFLPFLPINNVSFLKQ